VWGGVGGRRVEVTSLSLDFSRSLDHLAHFKKVGIFNFT